MPPVATASVLILRTIASGLEAQGVPPRRLLEELELKASDLADPDARVPHRVILAAWEAAQRLASDADFALHLAQNAPIGSFDLVDYVLRNAATLGDALETYLRYQRLMHTASGFRLETRGGMARLTHSLAVALPLVPRQPSEFMFATLLVRLRRLAGRDWAPEQVSFQHAKPARTSEHQRLFRAPVLFGQAVNEMSFDEALLCLPMVGADPGLKAVLERQGVAMLARLPSDEDFISKVRYQIAVAMRGHPPPIDAVARTLGMSRRSLQRRLSEEGVSYQGLLDATRRDIAERQLRERKRALSEIAFVLGFSEASAFHRAFRRWTGMTPSEYLRQSA